MQGQITQEIRSLQFLYEVRSFENCGETDHAPYDQLILLELEAAKSLVEDHWGSNLIPGLVLLFEGIRENLKESWPLRTEYLRHMIDDLREAEAKVD